jgi:hypothetical protein
MSKRLISRSADLKRLQDEGYEIEVRGAHLLLHNVPYVTQQGQIAYGTLVSTLELSGELTIQPEQHVAHFIGGIPCDGNGSVLEKVVNQSGACELAPGLVADHLFSSKPVGDGRYADYHEKMTSYVAMLASPAAELDADVTARIFPFAPEEIAEAEESEEVFVYRDTASSRGQIEAMSEKLRVGPIAIVGLGGTGSYILDFLSKTRVTEIHLFDGDRFSQHNAFRAPGAATGSELEEKPQKVAYLHRRYSKMHRNIVPHDHFLDSSTLAELDAMQFVFLAIDDPDAKRPIVEHLQRLEKPFIDVGMDIGEVDGSLRGLIRTTIATSTKRDHLGDRISLETPGEGGDYDNNVQISELNALNAALAVIRFKKLFGFYADDVAEHNSVFVLSESLLISEDRE